MGSSAAAGQVDLKQTVSVRKLLIREDTAKYLRNFDSDSRALFEVLVLEIIKVKIWKS